MVALATDDTRLARAYEHDDTAVPLSNRQLINEALSLALEGKHEVVFKQHQYDDVDLAAVAIEFAEDNALAVDDRTFQMRAPFTGAVRSICLVAGGRRNVATFSMAVRT